MDRSVIDPRQTQTPASAGLVMLLIACILYPVAAHADGMPRWSCAETVVTPAPVWQGTPIACPFQIRNEGDAVLEVGVQAGCDVPFNGPPTRRIRPGGSETIIAYFDSTDTTEVYDHRIKFVTNDPRAASGTLRCRGSVLAPFDLTTNRLTLGRVARSDAVSYRTFDLKRGDGGAIAPKLVPFHAKEFDATLCEIAPGEHYELVIAIQPNLSVGAIHQTLRIETGVPETPVIPLVVTGIVPPRVTLLPKHFGLPADRNQDMALSIRLIWDDGKPAEIADVACTIPSANASATERGGWQLIELSLPAGPKPAGNNHSVTVTTRDSAAPTITIPIEFY